MASRPLLKLRPLPVASSFRESLRAALSSAIERFAFARDAHALSAAAALRLPVRALSAAISRSLSCTVTLVIDTSRTEGIIERPLYARTDCDIGPSSQLLSLQMRT